MILITPLTIKNNINLTFPSLSSTLLPKIQKLHKLPSICKKFACKNNEIKILSNIFLSGNITMSGSKLQLLL